jgi:hypothetical protein
LDPFRTHLSMTCCPPFGRAQIGRLTRDRPAPYRRAYGALHPSPVALPTMRPATRARLSLRVRRRAGDRSSRLTLLNVSDPPPGVRPEPSSRGGIAASARRSGGRLGTTIASNGMGRRPCSRSSMGSSSRPGERTAARYSGGWPRVLLAFASQLSQVERLTFNSRQQPWNGVRSSLGCGSSGVRGLR